MPNIYTNIAICIPDTSRDDEFDCNAFNAKHNKTNLCQEIMPMPAELVGTKSPGDNPNWYDWQFANWGVKWGTFDLKAIQLDGDCLPVAVQFTTPWGPPKILDKIEEWLKKNGGFSRVMFVGVNPYYDSIELLSEDG